MITFNDARRPLPTTIYRDLKYTTNDVTRQSARSAPLRSCRSTFTEWQGRSDNSVCASRMPNTWSIKSSSTRNIEHALRVDSRGRLFLESLISYRQAFRYFNHSIRRSNTFIEPGISHVIYLSDIKIDGKKGNKNYKLLFYCDIYEW